MPGKISKEEKIRKGFEAFFDDFEGETWRSSDFKRFQKSIYNILCKEYKDPEDKIDRARICEEFVPIDKRDDFRHTNTYDREGIIKAFMGFFDSQKKRGKTTWSRSDLEDRNESLLMTISKKYGYQGTQVVDREKFEKEYDLERLGCRFIRNAPVRTPITVENINKELSEVISDRGQKTWSPDTLFVYKPQYLKRLGKRYRDKNGKIDRLYIIHKVFDDKEVINGFRHRYAYDRLLEVPSRTKKRETSENATIERHQNRKDADALDPEEIIISKEEEDAKRLLLQRIYDAIERIISKEEKEILFGFLEGDATYEKRAETIIKRLREDMDDQDSRFS